MNLDEAIEHARQVASECDGECSTEHAQLADWLGELRALRVERESNAYRIARMKVENDDLRRLANIEAKLFFLMNQCPSVRCDICEARHLCEESVHLEGLYGIDKDLA